MTDFSTANLSVVVLAGLGLAVGPALWWFAFRYVKGKVTKAFFKGKL